VTTANVEGGTLLPGAHGLSDPLTAPRAGSSPRTSPSPSRSPKKPGTGPGAGVLTGNDARERHVARRLQVSARSDSRGVE
jgi:hypothetical protein